MAKEKVKSDILKALEFVRVISKTEESAIVTMSDNYLAVVTHVMRAYHPIRDDLRFSTDLEKYYAAIKTVGDRTYQATVDRTLKISAGRFKVELPLLNEADVPRLSFEAVDIPIGPDFLQALSNASVPTTPGANRVAYSGVYASADATFVGTDGNVLIESWHGYKSLKSNIVIPTDFIRVLERLNKAGRTPTHAMADDYIFAVKFDDGAILITQLYIEQYVNYERIIEFFSGVKLSPDGLDEIKAAFDELEPFGRLYRVSASSINCGQASVTMASNYAYCIRKDHWHLVKHLIKAFDAHSRPNLVWFTDGQVTRGCIVKVDEDAANRLSAQE